MHRPWLIGQRATVRSVQAGGQIFGQMWREGVQQIEERAQHRARTRIPLGGFITENHERGDRRVEPHAFEVFGDLLDAGVQCLQLFISRFHIRNGHVQFQLRQTSLGGIRRGGDGLFVILVATVIDEQPPNAAEESVHSLDTLRAPRLHHLQRAHEHFVQAEGVGAVFANHHVGIDHVAAALAHLLAVLAENDALIHQPLERFRRGDMPEIKQHLVPEPRVKQV